MASNAPLNQCIAVCDPVSTGGTLAAELASRGYHMIKVWTSDCSLEFKEHIPKCAQNLEWLGEVTEQPELAQTVAAVRSVAGKYELIACVVGGESGVTLADALSEALGLRTNGTELASRRDKSVQQKLVKAAGLRSTREASGTTLEEVREFLNSEPMPCIVKPVESCGSDGVKKCCSIAEAEAHFEVLMKAQHKCGAFGAAVICQEFLSGKEYVVDHVSRDGVHMTTMCYVYDKRPTNGGEFVYYNILPVPSDSEVAKVLIPYIRGVIDALKIKHGPTHAEVMLTHDGTPCLVEMNCRAHGWDGAWVPLCRALTGGYSQVDVAADAILDEDAFNRLPDVYPSFCAGGQMVALVSNFEGVIAALPGYDAIQALPSFSSMEVGSHIAVGAQLQKTIDLFTAGGLVILCHPDPKVVAKDEAFIRQMELDGGLFELQ